MESESVTKKPDRFPEWANRPLALAAIGLIVGLVAGPVNLSLAIITALFAFGRKGIWTVVFVALGFELRPAPIHPVSKTTPFRGEVTITNPPRRSPYATLVVANTNEHRYRVQLPAGTAVTKWARYSVIGELKPSPDSYAESDLRMGIEGVLVPTRIGWREVAPGPAFFAASDQLSLAFHEYLNRFPINEAALMEALVTGTDGFFDDSVKASLRNGGVIHLIAASGMQVQIFATVLAVILRLAPIPRWLQVSILLVLLTFYAALAGLGVSILRAVIMAAIEALSPFFRRLYDPISSLSFAAIVLLVANPYWGMAPGFYLSFGGMLALILGSGWLRNRKPAQQAFGESAAAAITTLPSTMFFFGGVATYGSVATLALSYPASALMLLSLVGFAVERAGLWLLQVPIDFVCETIARTFLAVVDFVSNLPGAYMNTTQMDPSLIAWTFFFVALMWRPRRIEKPT